MSLKLRLLVALVTPLALALTMGSAQSESRAPAPEPESPSRSFTPDPVTDLTTEQIAAIENAVSRVRNRITQTDRTSESRPLIQVSIHLDKPPLDRSHYRSLQRSTASRSELFDATFKTLRDADSAGVHAMLERLGGRFHSEIRYLDSAILAEIPAHAMAQIEAHPHVRRVSQLFDMELHLGETVSFIGAGPQGLAGVTGAGVKVGVLDSGIDYTHAAFGGLGTTAAYQAAYFGGTADACPDPEDASTCHHSRDPQDIGQEDFFGPQATATNIRGGFDFVGETWPVGDLAPDPNPIDFQGHGTHVADIIGGQQGVAPGVDLYAYKVCSAVAGSCSGTAIFLGLVQAWADEVDIVNLSLGAPWGQPVSSSSHLLDLLANAGILGVASAGNSGDQPFVVGSPSSATAALSVAQSNVPSASLPRLEIRNGVGETDPLITNDAVWQPWSVPPAAINLPLIYGDGANGNTLGCNSFGDKDLSGLVVLVDRGVCNFSLKAANASAAGAAAVVIAMVNADPPFASGSGGHEVTITAYMVSQAVGNSIRTRLTNLSAPRLIVDPENFIDASRGIASTTSRGPRNHDNRLKPEIAAPGASVSAVAGSGTGSAAFGGTSGAAPMVAGAAALLIEHFSGSQDFGPLDIKTLLMNHADPELYVSVLDGTLAPISRIGAGLVQIGEAADWKLLVRDITDPDPLTQTGAISLGYRTPGQTEIVNRTLRVINISSTSVTLTPEATFRFANDENVGVSVSLSPASATIAAGGSQNFTVSFTIDPAQVFDARPSGAFPRRGQEGNTSGGAALTAFEFDGYIVFREAGARRASVPWHLLPRPASLVEVTGSSIDGGTISHSFSNTAVLPAQNNVFQLFEENPSWGLIAGDCASQGLDPGCDQDGIDLKHIGYLDSGDVMFFAASIYDPPFRAGALPVSLELWIDVDRDGDPDFLILNTQDNSLGNIVLRIDLSTNQVAGAFYTDSRFNSNVFILPATRPASLAPGQLFDFWVAAWNDYHGGYYDCAPHVSDLVRPFDNADICRTQGVFTARYGQPSLVGDLFADMTSGGSVSISHRVSASGSNAQGLLLINNWGPIGNESIAIPVDFQSLEEIFRDRFQATAPNQ